MVAIGEREGRVSQIQVKRAAELGLGVRDAGRIELISRSVEGNDPAFERLVDRIRRDVYGAGG